MHQVGKETRIADMPNTATAIKIHVKYCKVCSYHVKIYHKVLYNKK